MNSALVVHMMNGLRKRTVYQSPLRLLILLAVTIFAAEAIIMFFLRILAFPQWVEDLLDSFSLSIVISPMLYFFVFRPSKLYISEIKQGEESLKQSEEKYRLLVENIPAVAYIGDAEGKTIFITQNVEKVYGYTPEEIYSGGSDIWFGRIHPDDLEYVKKEYGLFFKENKPLDVEYRIRRKDGEWIWLHDKVISSHQEKGILYLYGLFSDVSERKKAEQAISDSEERYRQLFEGSGDAIFVHPMLDDGSPGNFIEVNPVACKRLGYTREELLKLSPAVIDDPEMASQRNKAITDILAKKHIVFEVAHVAKDGRKIPVEINANFFNLKGRAMILSVVRDIAERKRMEDELRDSEKKYRKLFENTSNGIVIFDSETLRFEDVNTACLNLYGYTKEEFLSLSPLDMSAEVEKSRISVQKGLDSELTHIPLRYHKKKDGTVFPVEIFAGAFFHKGRKKGIGVIVDLTERMRSEEELRLAYREVKEKGEKLERFNRLMVGRELEMIKLKTEVNELLEKAGQPDRYETPERVKKADA